MRSPSTGTVEDFFSALFYPVPRGQCLGHGLLVEGLRMAHDFSHDPVMAHEVVDLLRPVPPGLVVDGTVGGGGHAAAILAEHEHLCVLGLDRDPEAVAAARERLRGFGRRAAVRRATFARVRGEVAAAMADPLSWPRSIVAGESAVSGVLLDLGVSSPQIERAERGFSYARNGPLDMRMDPETAHDAADLVNGADESELAALFAANGEERLARRIARAVVAGRPVTTTGQLAEIVAGAVPAALRRRGHPARRVFQALRIAVNDELGQLASVLPDVLSLLAVGGRTMVISYHSGEDRLVKRTFAEAAKGSCTCPARLPCVCGALPVHQLVFRGARKPQAEEVARNRRAESARLRCIERTGEAA